jgi:hypothetical protein
MIDYILFFIKMKNLFILSGAALIHALRQPNYGSIKPECFSK